LSRLNAAKKIILFLLLTSKLIVFSQKKDSCYAGVYLTQEDFLANRLSFVINKDAKGYKFGFPIPADWKLEIKIVRPDTVIKFKEGTVYGYSECGKVFRYFAGGELYADEDFYRIEEIKGLVIYTSAFNGGDEFFYSHSLTDKIHRLKIKNIERDFKDKQEFVDAVKRLNKTGEHGNIEKRDKEGRFIINKIYEEKIKNK